MLKPVSNRANARALRPPLLKSRARHRLWGIGLLLPSLIGFLWFYAVPFGMTIFYSLVRGVTSPQFVFLDNYKTLFRSESFRLALLNTVKFLLIGVPLLTALSLFLAWLLHYLSKKHAVSLSGLRGALVLPMVIPTAGIVLFVQILLESRGVLNGVLTGLGFDPVLFLNSNAAFWVLLALYLWKNAGYLMVIFLAALGETDPVIDEAAAIDGADEGRRFFHVTLPQIAPSAVFVIVLSFVGVFKIFRESYLLSGDYPHESIYMLQNFLNNNFASQNIQRLTSASTIFLLLMVAVIGLLLYFGNRERE